jgi:parallel beta-helix repeat protein
MSFWDGYQWIEDRPSRAVQRHPGYKRAATWLATLAMVFVAAVGLVPRDGVSAGNADRPNHGLGHQPTPAPTASPDPSVSSSPTTTASPTPSPKPTATSSASPSPSLTASPTQSPTPSPSAASGTFYVSTGGNDSGTGSLTSPWRTIDKAVATAPAGSTIRVFGGTYAPFTVRRAHLAVLPVTGELVTVSGGTSAVSILAGDTLIRGLRITNASAQGIWVDSASGVVLSGVTLEANIGHGIQIIRSTDVEVSDSLITSNKLSGIRELDGTTSGRYLRNVITDNGHDGQAYNGDGILLKGSNGLASGNTILRNGDSALYEHGIYAAATASGYRIENNVVRGNSASGIKASGSGTVIGNTIDGSPRGVVFADDGGLVQITGNSIGATQDVILVTSNCNISRYRSDYNTFVVKPFGYLGQALDLPGWRSQTGLDQHSQ